MQSEIGPYLEKLLYTNNTVVIPGLGAFVASPASADIDYAGGKVSPPNKSLTFNEGLTTNDGLILYELVKERNISEDDARQWIEKRVEEIHEQLSKREIVTFLGVGRLYKNYGQKIQFLPDAANFSRENFGLPPLQFTPLSRSREVTTSTESVSPATTSRPLAVEGDHSIFNTPARQGIPWGRILTIVGLLGLSFGVGWYFLNGRKPVRTTSEIPASPTDTLTENTTAEISEKTPAETPATEKSEAPAAKKEAPVTEKRAPQPAPATAAKNCVAGIGLFKDPGNISRLKSLLTSNGYQVKSTTTKSGAESIDAVFSYTSNTEYNQKLDQLKKLTGVSNPRIKK